MTYLLPYIVVITNSKSFIPSVSRTCTDMNGWSVGHMLRLGSSLFCN